MRPLSLALSVCLAGCSSGPLLVWHGRSADRARHAVVVEQDGQTRAVVDGAPHGDWDAISVAHLRWTSAGRLVYPAQRGPRWHLVVDGQPGAGHRGVAEVTTAGARIAYAAREEDGWHVVVDGEPGPAFVSLRSGALSMTADGRRVGYVGRDASGEHAVVDGEVGRPFDRVDHLRFGAKGQLAAYVGHEPGGARIVIDGTPGPLHEEVLELALATDEPRWAALAVDGGSIVALRDGAHLAAAPGASRLLLSADGARVAWVVRAGDDREVWLDAERVGTHESVARLRFVPRTGALVYVIGDGDGQRVVHAGTRSPRFASVEGPVVSPAGHWGYVGRRPAGCAVVIDGEAVHRGEWAGGLALAARSERWAVVARRAGRRFVLTPDGRTAIARPFADTLVLEPDGVRWGLAVALPDERRLAILVDGREVAPLDVDEMVAGVTQLGLGRTLTQVARAIIAGELAASR